MARPIDIRIDTRGTLEQVRGQLAAMPQGVERARKRAARKLGTWARRQVLRTIAQAVEVPQKVIGANKRFTATVLPEGGLRIWVGTNPIPAHRLGTVRWTRNMAGARAGRRLFPETWSWGPGSRTGTAIMYRNEDVRVMTKGRYQGKVREAIDRWDVLIHDHVLARITGMEPEIGERYSTLLLQELNYALRVEAARNG